MRALASSWYLELMMEAIGNGNFPHAILPSNTFVKSQRKVISKYNCQKAIFEYGTIAKSYNIDTFLHLQSNAKQIRTVLSKRVFA